MATFEEIEAKWDPVPIRNCPGRFVLRTGDERITPEEVAPGVEFNEFQVEKATDNVIVGTFAGGGLITYKRADGTYLHTLNTPDGLQRKLHQLGIHGI